MKQRFTLFYKNYWNKNYEERTSMFYLLFSLLVLFSSTIELHAQTISQNLNGVTSARQANDCDDFTCGNNNDKVLVCHVPSENPDNEHEICISPSALEAHLTHGDYCGPCELLSNSTLEHSQNVSIYPNPFTTHIFLELDNDVLLNNENIELILFDLLGREIKRLSSINKTKLEIDMSSLKHGILIYTIRSEKELLGVGKILKK